MKNIFLDTNIIIDFLANREPYAIPAAVIFNFAAERKINLFISAVSYNNIYYILRQSLTNIHTMKLLEQLSEFSNITDVTEEIIKKSIRSDFKDFEDAIQYNSALTIPDLDAIVTRDTKDFKKSTVTVLSPEEAIRFIELDSLE